MAARKSPPKFPTSTFLTCFAHDIVQGVRRIQKGPVFALWKQQVLHLHQNKEIRLELNFLHHS